MTGEKRRSCITGIYLFIRVLHFLKLGSKCSKRKRKKNQVVLPEPDEEEEDWRTGAGGTVATFIRANVKSISIPLYLESEVCQHLGNDVNEVFTNRRLKSELNAWTHINLQVCMRIFLESKLAEGAFFFVCDSSFPAILAL